MLSRCQCDLTEPFGYKESSGLSNGMTVCLGSGQEKERKERKRADMATNSMFRAVL